MLRRAASNAYSWWWASHVRTKQSKWLEENLQDIEEKVQYALKLLEDEGDSFAKRAEMYYKRRPELISFVEEAFKAYRALAERYDHISKELQNANTTIASVFPEQVPEFAMNEEDDPASHVSPRKHNNKTQNVPKVPEFPLKISEVAKLFKPRKSITEHATSVVNKSGLSKTEAVEEIDKLQKEILALQTEKEFVKSSYENALAKYWEIENFIMEKQGKVCNLQDEFDECVVIEDKEAQILMSTTALKSCQEKLEEMNDKHEKNVEETEIARKQIREETEEFGNLDDTLLGEKAKEGLGLGLKTKEEDFECEANSCLTITDVADKIDELVNDVINLENLLSSQAALIHRLREEIDDLKAQIRALQKENNSSQTDEITVMRNKIEDKLKGIKDIDQAIEEQSQKTEKQLTQAHIKLSFLSKRLKILKQEGEGFKVIDVPIQEAKSLTDTKILDDSVVSENDLGMKSEPEVVVAEKVHSGEVKKEEEGFKATNVPIPEAESLNDTKILDDSVVFENDVGIKSETEVVIDEKDHTDEVNQEEESSKATNVPDLSENDLGMKSESEEIIIEKDHTSEVNQEETSETTQKEASLEKPILSPKSDIEGEDEAFLHKLLALGIEGREKHLLMEYTKVLRKNKEIKKMLEEAETKLKSENTIKDEQVRVLNHKLNLSLKGKSNGDEDDNDLQRLQPKDHRQEQKQKDQLFMLICREDNAIKSIARSKKQKLLSEERQFEARVDALLGENLNLLVRFSNSFGQIQQFDNGIKDLHAELLKIIEQKNQEGSLRSNVRPIYKHLSKIRTELTIWLEKSLMLKEEINLRASTLKMLQNEITEALKTDSEDSETKLTIYQGAKFEGEVSNMKKENNRISEELQTGLDQVTKLQKEVDKTLEKVNEEFSLSDSKKVSTSQNSKTRIPLRSFIFDIKPKKQRISIFSCIQPSLYKKKPPSS